MTDEEKVSKVIDRLYMHEFVMDELNAAVEEYVRNYSGYSYEAEEVKNVHKPALQDILNKRLMKDLKEILSMC